MNPDILQANIDLVTLQLQIVDKQAALSKLNLAARLTDLQNQLAKAQSVQASVVSQVSSP